MSLYLACGLTMAIETAYFYLIGYRKREFLIVCLAVNAATNLTLNLVLQNTGFHPWLVFLSEITVIGVEYAVYCLALKPTGKLLLHTVIANVLSFAIGEILQKAVLI